MFYVSEPSHQAYSRIYAARANTGFEGRASKGRRQKKWINDLRARIIHWLCVDICRYLWAPSSLTDKYWLCQFVYLADGCLFLRIHLMSFRYPAKRDLYNEATRHLVFKYSFLGDKPHCGMLRALVCCAENLGQWELYFNYAYTSRALRSRP